MNVQSSYIPNLDIGGLHGSFSYFAVSSPSFCLMRPDGLERIASCNQGSDNALFFGKTDIAWTIQHLEAPLYSVL